MSVKEGDFLLIDYICKVKENNEVIDTTYEEVAKENDLTKDEHGHERSIFEPQFVIIGEGRAPKGLEDGLKKSEIGKKIEIEVPPEKGYGNRDPSKMRLIPLRRFRKEGINPVPGIQVTIDNKPALIRSVGAGRVQADFNHPLAGKTLTYEVVPKKILKTKEEKIIELIHKHMPSIKRESFKIEIKEGNLSIEIPNEAFFIEGLQFLKRSLADDLWKFLPTFKKVSFIEGFKKAKSASEEKPKQD